VGHGGLGEPAGSLHWILESIPRFNVRPYRSGIGQHNRNVALYRFIDRGRVLPTFQIIGVEYIGLLGAPLHWTSSRWERISLVHKTVTSSLHNPTVSSCTISLSSTPLVYIIHIKTVVSAVVWIGLWSRSKFRLLNDDICTVGSSAGGGKDCYVCTINTWPRRALLPPVYSLLIPTHTRASKTTSTRDALPWPVLPF